MQFAMSIGVLIICLNSANIQYAQLIFVVVSAAVFLLQIVPVGDLNAWFYFTCLPLLPGDPDLRYFFL